MDASQLAEIIDRYAGPLALYAAQWTSSADDVVQEALIKLIDQQSPPEAPAAWLYTVVRNLALSERRATHRRHAREQIAVRLRGSDRSDSEALELADALDQLDTDQREVVIAKVWGDLSLEEIARTTATSTSTVHRRYHEGLTHLRKLLEQPCTTK